MALAWNEIKDRALAFSREWIKTESENSDAKPFWIEFFHVFGITSRRIGSFEQRVKKLGGRDGYIDWLWKGNLLIEHKSRGKDLDRAYRQAIDYFPGLKEHELPRFILVSDFVRFRLYDTVEGTQTEFLLKEFHKFIKLFWFIAGYQPQKISPQSPVNAKAVQRMAKLHDRLKQIGYTGHALEVYLVRLLFCLFAEDTGIFERTQFTEFIEQQTREDGSDLAPQLAQLFDVLNTPEAARLKNLDDTLTRFPYINGKLFEERLPFASFDSHMRAALLYCCALDWSGISPAIFGSLFQNIIDETPNARRNLGAHYTTEENILKLIRPLFLDELHAEFAKIKHNAKRLQIFHNKLASLKFLDPACGCGNFLVIAYRELRRLELEVLRALHDSGQQTLDITSIIQVDVDQFHGIEIEEFPAQIAQVALWLTDHQMNALVSEEFGQYFIRLPLNKSAHIVHGNALRLNWNTVIAAEECNVVMGNPPFIGAKFMNETQRTDVATIFHDTKNAGLLDYVTCWYRKATDYITAHPAIRAAFVSTNSITQGEQVGVLWPDLLRRGAHIHYAHRTFQWMSEAKGKAAVHCVIIGFGLLEATHKTIFEYVNIKGEPHAVAAKNINPYLVDSPNLFLENRNKPICSVPEIGIGSQPIDDGNFLFTTEEKKEFLKRSPKAEKYFYRWLGAVEFLNGYERWCLWLGDCPPNELRQLPEAMSLVEAVKNFRLKSKRAQTLKAADTPTHFGTELIPTTPYLLIPKVSSERRNFIPLGFMQPDTFCSDLVFMLPNATLYHFGILTSTMHNAWMRTVCGRLKSDYRYSVGIVYNNFPWPEIPPNPPLAKGGGAQRGGIPAIETAAQAVLNARAQFPDATLADLYDPLAMPPELVRAHQALDRAVDAAYGKKSFASEAERVAFLFERYQAITSLLPATSTKKSRNSRH
ncbi:class I SAM-dependent DNA methyltransferase [Nitrosomonas ureae]|uniref:site-specific DNA-methyltransferase (adenine-specific) n=1 Tax=Nitrosomonas ureae TaxID=44577 RepID=A0A1H8ZSM9_9PROT|nr:DNA methyltransferase [Nitrosomonas ureae]SEP67273.1 Type II restriction/modification system, DNA methylase subunit YeeA [Nitrosomonas ureae]